MKMKSWYMMAFMSIQASASRKSLIIDFIQMHDSIFPICNDSIIRLETQFLTTWLESKWVKKMGEKND